MKIDVRPVAPNSEGARAFLAEKTKRLLIGGRWVEASTGRTFPTFDPANGQKLAELAEGGVADIDAAVASARAAFVANAWRGLTPSARDCRGCTGISRALVSFLEAKLV